MPLVYLPDPNAFFWWGDGAPAELAIPVSLAQKSEVELLVPDGRSSVAGLLLPILETAGELAVIPRARLETASGSVAIWALASQLAIELVSRQRVVPTLTRRAGRIEARWAAALSASEDAARVAALARSMPPSAHAVPVAGGSPLTVWSPDALLRALLDAFVRGSHGAPAPAGVRGRSRPKPAALGGALARSAAGAGEQLFDGGFRRALRGPRPPAVERARSRRARSPSSLFPAGAADGGCRAVHVALPASVTRRSEPPGRGLGGVDVHRSKSGEARPRVSRPAGVLARSARARVAAVRAHRGRAFACETRGHRARSRRRLGVHRRWRRRAHGSGLWCHRAGGAHRQRPAPLASAHAHREQDKATWRGQAGLWPRHG